jgi:hypothetical protein
MTIAKQLSLFKSRRQRGVALPPPLEFYLHVSIIDILQRWINPGWRFNHIASGEYRLPATAARLKRMGVQKGWPDIIIFPPLPSRGAMFLELKRRGGRLSPAQQAFADWAHDHGYAHEVIADYASALVVLRGWGVIRTGITPQ